ncbi:MAG: hypothetical protein NT080_04595 [Spirochaetes bacterium]|nr:hypothetical protein [Spirochaetota bacterium]
MDDLILSLAASGPFAQAVAVTIGGMTGVFATLFIFYLIIKAFEILKPKKEG